MDWTGADERVMAADRPAAHTRSAGGRAADNPRLVAHGQANSQGWRQNKFENVRLAFSLPENGELRSASPISTHCSLVKKLIRSTLSVRVF